MTGVKQVAIAASVALLITAAGVAYKKRAEGQSAWKNPTGYEQIVVDWETGLARMPQPNPEEGVSWKISYSRDNVLWEQSWATYRDETSCEATFPSDCRSIRCWVTGGKKPTYSVQYDNPRRK